MLLTPAVEADFEALVALANLAYRGSGDDAGWSTEAGIVEGLRLTLDTLRSELAAKPEAHLLVYRDTIDGPLLGSVWLQPVTGASWYLGLLTIHPGLQNRQLGRTLLAAAEEFARAHGGSQMRMTVLNVRATLMSWYERRGYRATGETQPFPYGDDRFGKPLRNDLHFIVLERPL